MYETLDGEPIVVVTCEECGKRQETCYGKTLNGLMQRLSLCFDCLFWFQRVEEKDQPTSVRIQGRHYIIHADDASKPHGFGGNLMTIEFFDGHIVETRNLWTQGIIPEKYRDKLPDNARFR